MSECVCVRLGREQGCGVEAAESSLWASKVRDLPAVEDWQTEEQMTMEEHQGRTEETVSLSEHTLTCDTHCTCWCHKATSGRGCCVGESQLGANLYNRYLHMYLGWESSEDPWYHIIKILRSWYDIISIKCIAISGIMFQMAYSDFNRWFKWVIGVALQTGHTFHIYGCVWLMFFCK